MVVHILTNICDGKASPKGISSKTCARITFSSSSALPTAFHFSLLLPSPHSLSQLSSPLLYFCFMHTYVCVHTQILPPGGTFFFPMMLIRGNICTQDGFSTNPKRNTLFENKLHTRSYIKIY